MGLIRSWLESANSPDCPFPLNNLPCGVFSTGEAAPRCGVAIGDFVLDVAGLEQEGLVVLDGGPLLDVPFWNEVMGAGPPVWDALRDRLARLLAEDAPDRAAVEPFLTRLTDVALHMPFRVAEYSDFYAGRDHAFNVGSMFRGPEDALPPNWLHVPTGYNGRASSIVVSGTPVRRPWGQVKEPDHAMPSFQPSRRFDFELEVGAVIGRPSQHGRPVTVAEADEMIFGYVLLNDWSARDIQTWEYQPLGPFQSKAAATTISPWIVMKAALEPFRTRTPEREVPLLPYLAEPRPMLYEIALEVALTPEAGTETVIARTSYAGMYYSAPQLVAHHTTSGCAMNTGDLLGSGTISGPTQETRGSLLERSWGGAEPFAIAGGTRTFLEDNDTVTLRGRCRGPGYTIGFGECVGKVIPALSDPYAR